jgi:hypothetical protein
MKTLCRARFVRHKNILSSFLVSLAFLTGCGSGAGSGGTPIAPTPVSITTTTLPFAATGVAYAATLLAAGGTLPYSFVLKSGTLPAGLTLSSAGTIAGTTTVSGIATITIQVTDSSSVPLTASSTFTLSVAGVQVQLNTSNSLTTLPQTAYGMHTSVYDAALTDVAGLPAALSTAGISMLRYPGGVYSDNYHWAQYSLTPWFASSVPACGITQNGYLAPNTDLGHFVKTLQATSTQAIITVNYGTSLAGAAGTRSTGSYGPNTCSEPNTSGQPAEAAAWVAYANGSTTNTMSLGIDSAGFNWQTVGFWATLRASTPLAVDDGYNFLRIGQASPIGIKYWELGNEIFYDGYNSNQNYETDLHAPYIYSNGYTGSFKSRSNVGAISPAAYGKNAIAFLQAMKAVDATIQVGLDLSSPNVDPIPATWNPAAIQAVCAGANFNFGILHYYPGSFNAVTSAQLLSLPQSDMPRLLSTIATQVAQSCPSAGAVPIFVTETGPNGSYASGVPSQMTGLYAANVYLAAFAAGVVNVDWLELHSGSFLSYTNGVETPATAYYGIELAHLFAAPGDKLVATTSSSTNLIARGSAKSNGSTGVFLLNADPANAATVLVTVAGASLSSSAKQYSYGIATTQTAQALPQSVLTVPSSSSFFVIVPPYTATTIIVP